METVQARSIHLPKLGGVLQFSIISVPDVLAAKAAANPEMVLAEAIRFIFGYPASHVITFGRWKKIQGAIEARIISPQFADQLRTSIAANDQEERERFEADLLALQTTVRNVKKRTETAGDFGLCMVRNAVLNAGFHMTQQQLVH